MRKMAVLIFCISMALVCISCSRTAGNRTEKKETDISPGLTYSHSMETVYAEQFAVDYYEDGYALITIKDESRYLVVPEGHPVPEKLAEDIVPLLQPVNKIYLVASAVMDMFVALDALNQVRFSGMKAEGWYIAEARAAMESGEILYAGNYSAPDYEKILSENCGLAVENTMIYHNPEVKEQLEKLGIPVLVDHSSYEEEPLGRTEWVKLYGVLVGKEEEAEEAFRAQMEAFTSVSSGEVSNKSVAFFYITSNGEANVRNSLDYLPKMIEMAGGHYIFEDLKESGRDGNLASSTITMQMEQFYASAKEADYIVYNSAIEGELSSVEELIAKSSLLENFRAVQEGNVYCTTRNLYQSSMELGIMIQDIHRMLSGEEDDLTYLYKLK